MKKSILCMTLFFLFAASQALAGGASMSPSADPLKDGASFPNLALTGPISAEQAEYLGLSDAKSPYSLNEIGAPILIVQIFSMYCPFCQAEAPAMNELYAQIGGADLANRIKLIGVGAGNSDFEVNVFKEKYELNFPVFSDMEFTAHKAVGEVGTPFFYVLKKEPSGGYDILFSSLGRMDSPEKFLKTVRDMAKL